MDRPSRDVHVHHLALLTSNSAWDTAAGWADTDDNGDEVVPDETSTSSDSHSDSHSSSRSIRASGSSGSSSNSVEDKSNAITSRQIGLAPAEAKQGVLAETPPFLLARISENGEIAHAPRPVHHAKPSRDNNDKRGRGSRKKKKDQGTDSEGEEGGSNTKGSSNDSESATLASESPPIEGEERGEGNDKIEVLVKEDEVLALQSSTELPPLPYFALDIACGGGTYVRSLIDDIAMHPKVSVYAHSLLHARVIRMHVNIAMHFGNKNLSAGEVLLQPRLSLLLASILVSHLFLCMISGQQRGTHGVARAHEQRPVWPFRLPASKFVVKYMCVACA